MKQATFLYVTALALITASFLTSLQVGVAANTFWFFLASVATGIGGVLSFVIAVAATTDEL